MINILKIPSINNDVELKSEDGILYLHHKSENKVLILENLVAEKIINCCDGKSKIEDIVSIIWNEYPDTSKKIIESDLIEMLKLFEKEDFITYIE